MIIKDYYFLSNFNDFASNFVAREQTGLIQQATRVYHNL